MKLRASGDCTIDVREQASTGISISDSLPRLKIKSRMTTSIEKAECLDRLTHLACAEYKNYLSVVQFYGTLDPCNTGVKLTNCGRIPRQVRALSKQ